MQRSKTTKHGQAVCGSRQGCWASAETCRKLSLQQHAMQTAGRQQSGRQEADIQRQGLGLRAQAQEWPHLELHDLLDLGGVPLADGGGAHDLHRQYELSANSLEQGCQGLAEECTSYGWAAVCMLQATAG